MLFTSALPFVAALATLATAVEAKTPFMDHHYESHSPAKPLTSSVNSTPFLKHQPHHKRLLCGLLGLFCGADYSSDVRLSYLEPLEVEVGRVKTDLAFFYCRSTTVDRLAGGARPVG